jgi:hypothetical protein
VVRCFRAHVSRSLGGSDTGIRRPRSAVSPRGALVHSAGLDPATRGFTRGVGWAAHSFSAVLRVGARVGAA